MAIKIHTMLGLLTWFFTPVKLYAGDGGAEANDTSEDNTFGGAYSGHQQAAQNYADSQNEYGTSEQDFQDAIDENYANEHGLSYGGNRYGGGASLSKNQLDAHRDAFNAARAAEAARVEQERLDAISLDRYNTAKDKREETYNYNFDSINMEEQTIEQMVQDFMPKNELDVQVTPNTITVGGVPAPYAANASAYLSSSITANMFGMVTHSSTMNIANSLGGYNVTHTETDAFGTETNSYTTRVDGTIEEHTTVGTLGNAISYSYDTHYWEGSNTEFGFAAEMTADALEYFGVKTSTVRTAAATVEVGMMLFNVVMPSMQMLAGARAAYAFNKTIGSLMAITGFIGMYESLTSLSNMFGDEFGAEGLDRSMMGSFESLGDGNGEQYELGSVIQEELYNSEFIPSLIGTGAMQASAAMMPKINKPTSFIRPKNEESNMQSQQAVFIDYRGGLSEILSPNLIGANEGSIYQNISIDRGILESRKLGTVGTSKLGAYYKFLPNDKLFYSDYPFSMIELGNFMYLTTENPTLDGVYQLDYVAIDADCTDANLVQVQLDKGVTAPTATAIGSVLAEEELWEEYTYAYTYYDKSTGFESAPQFSATFLKKTAELSITNIDYSTSTTVDVIRLYRLGGYSNSYRLVSEIDNTANTGSTTYTDACSEEYNPTILDTQNLSIVTDLIGLIEHKGTLFAYKENRVYFSRPGKPNMWSEFNTVRVGGIITGLASTPLGTLIFTSNNQTYLLGGTDKFNFTVSSLAKSTGAISYKSIANLKNTAIWLDYEGLMMSVGSTVSNISKEKVDLTDIGDIITSLVYDNVYYLVGTNYTLTVDLRYNTPAFSRVSGLTFITAHKGQLYMDMDGVHYIDAFAKVGDYMSMDYKAPMFIGNSYDILTEFNKINLTFKGDFTYKIYVDEVEVLSDNLSSDKVAVQEIKLPSDYNEGLGLELELIGTGEVKSFRYIFNNVSIN